MTTPNASPDDLTIDNLTPHVIKLSSNIENERLKFVFAKLIQYSHDFVRDTKLTTAEWEAAWQYLTEVRPIWIHFTCSVQDSLNPVRSANSARRNDKRRSCSPTSSGYPRWSMPSTIPQLLEQPSRQCWDLSTTTRTNSRMANPLRRREPSGNPCSSMAP